MVSFRKLLDAMRNNPNGDWTIRDIERVCRPLGIGVRPPRGGSHYVLSHSKWRELFTIPARRPIKPVYIRKLIVLIDGLESDTAE